MMSIETMEEVMPTKLIRRTKQVTVTEDRVPKSEFTALLNKYNEMMATGNKLLALIDEQDAYIDTLEHELEERLEIQLDHETETGSDFMSKSDFVYEPGVLKVKLDDKGVHMAKPKTKKKFAGATLEFDPFKRKLGIGIHFKTV